MAEKQEMTSSVPQRCVLYRKNAIRQHIEALKMALGNCSSMPDNLKSCGRFLLHGSARKINKRTLQLPSMLKDGSMCQL